MDKRNSDRIERLRDRAVVPIIAYEIFHLHFFKKFDEDKELPFYEKYSRAYEYAFNNTPAIIEEDELIVGRSNYILNENERAEWEYIRANVVEKAVVMMGQDSHMAIDFELVLSEGMLGVIAKIDKKLESASGEKAEFYKTCKVCLESVIRFSDSYAREAERQAQLCTDEIRKEELLNIAKVCARVPKHPASSFYEAVQAAHFICFCLAFDPYRFFATQQFQLGHPDRYLYPYYKADIESGKITKDDAQVLLDCLGIQISNRVHRGLSSGYMVGGRMPDGSIVANDLTEMGMQVVDDIRLVYPAVGLCYSKDTPDKYLEKACEILSHGRSHPAIFNDDVITAGLIEYGMPEEEAHTYIHSTCVEITPVASSNVWVASPYTNMPQLLLDSMDREYESFEDLMSAIYQKLDASIDANFVLHNDLRKTRWEKSHNPLLSCFVNDCLELGVDIEKGGARYNWIMPSFVGMANLVDSLYVVNEIVFKEKEMSMTEFKKILDSNFEGNEALRLRLLNKYPKYGNDIDEIDEYFDPIRQHIVDECKKYTPVFQNAKLIPSMFCWIVHEMFGRETIATPDGRRAGFPLADGSGACQGREINGPTAAILSTTKWSHKELIGGVAVNMKFSKKTFTENSSKQILDLIKVYMERGGFEMQINVVDRETLIAAQKDPENYRDLLVRIGGYSDYFVCLSENMQNEVIQRKENEI